MTKNHNVLITGGAGFIGSNLAARLLKKGIYVTIYDNLSRPGTEANLGWLQECQGSENLTFIRGDLQEFDSLLDATKQVDEIYHLAAQVAVTTSVSDPRHDFLNNALGTFNALEAARLSDKKPIFLYASTNKVYGKMVELGIIEHETRYAYERLKLGVPETYPLDFHSPYGCSKGAADQYVRDYARIYGLKTVVMRQGCIYGYRQLGIEDQGWVAWFMIAALKKRPITIYGDGKQVRDILFIDDLLNAYELAIDQIDKTAGNIYNIGGGPDNTMSIWREFGPILEDLFGHSIPVGYADWRPGDQKVYISNIQKACEDLNWYPQTTVEEGIKRLLEWIKANQELFSHL